MKAGATDSFGRALLPHPIISIQILLKSIPSDATRWPGGKEPHVRAICGLTWGRRHYFNCTWSTVNVFGPIRASTAE